MTLREAEGEEEEKWEVKVTVDDRVACARHNGV